MKEDVFVKDCQEAVQHRNKLVAYIVLKKW